MEENITDINVLYKNPYEITNDKEILKWIPYSIGIEIEAPINEKLDINIIEQELANIPYILASSKPDTFENRFRIPNGKEGLICLLEISNYCKKNLLLNKKSGLHYHVDCTEWSNYLNAENINSEIKDFILNDLESWPDKGNYNYRDISNSKGFWLSFRKKLSTIEYRIGEMTFDYPILLERIIHISKLTTILKNHLTNKRFNLHKLLNTHKYEFNNKLVNVEENEIKQILSNRYVVL